MDAIAGLLDGPRARDAFLLRSRMSPPWSLRIQDEAPLTVVAVVSGWAWLQAGRAARRIGGGDVAILRGPAPYTVADAPDRPAQAVILPGQRCTGPDGAEQHVMGPLGVRSWGNDPAGATEMLTGTYQVTREVSQRLLRALPPLIVLRAEEWDCPLIPLLADEIVKDEPGQEAVLDRLLDLLLIAVLRAWFARPDARAPGWYRGYADPVVGEALRQIYHAPQQPWTVQSLARAAGASRATLARRFTELVGETPMAFLAGWRIALATDLLREPQATLGAVARQVGYASPYALSAAFKRHRGVSPREYLAMTSRSSLSEKSGHGTVNVLSRTFVSPLG
jgi:AraC-like DNA-binding protein